MKETGWIILGLLMIAVSIFPWIIDSSYLIHVLTLTAMYVAFALSFDLGAGHLGAISLAHPAFFGLGAYVVGILGVKHDFPSILSILIGIVFTFVLAIVISRPAFRLREISFAIATLGFLLSAQIIVNNWLELTEGPMCIDNVPNLMKTVGFTNYRIGYYYLFILVATIVGGVYRVATTWRLGRVLTAIKNDEILASSIGIDVVRYQRFTFILGSTIAGLLGALWAYYMRVVCPALLSVTYTNTLLMIVFVGGAGSLYGVIFGAIFITVVPEVFRLAPELRMVLFGALLTIVVILIPGGMGGVLADLRKRIVEMIHKR